MYTHTEPSQPARQNWPEKFQPKSEKQNFYTGSGEKNTRPTTSLRIAIPPSPPKFNVGARRGGIPVEGKKTPVLAEAILV